MKIQYLVFVTKTPLGSSFWTNCAILGEVCPGEDLLSSHCWALINMIQLPPEFQWQDRQGTALFEENFSGHSKEGRWPPSLLQWVYENVMVLNLKWKSISKHDLRIWDPMWILPLRRIRFFSGRVWLVAWSIILPRNMQAIGWSNRPIIMQHQQRQCEHMFHLHCVLTTVWSH